MLRAATRGSPLARWQTDHVSALLHKASGARVVPLVVSTEGDRRAATPIHRMGGKGVFVSEVQAAVLQGSADIAVHSAKDLPSQSSEGLVLAAVPPRGDPRDALVGGRLNELRAGAVVATGAVRRRVQLAEMCPGLVFVELRGNISTRLARADRHDAIVMAAAALQRLELEPEVLDVLDVETMVPQAGQGALAVECRADDEHTLEALSAIEHTPSRSAVDAERAFLAELGGDCDLPAGAHATPTTNGSLRLTGLLAATDRGCVVRDTRSGNDPEALGRSVARTLAGRLDES